MKILALILVACLSGCATTERLSIEHVHGTDYRITGKLDQDEYDEIIRIVKAHPKEPITFYVSSGGGTSHDLFECMDALYQHGQVHWYSLDRCDSACAILALSTRHAHGNYRLHSFYRHKDHHKEPAPYYNNLVLDRLGKYGYDTDKLHHMFHSPEVLWDITLDDGVIVEH